MDARGQRTPEGWGFALALPGGHSHTANQASYKRNRNAPIMNSTKKHRSAATRRSRMRSGAAADRAPWDWRMLVNGLGDQLMYERGVIATNVPLAELKERGHVNARARAADKAEDFSRLIRQGVPGTDL